MLLFLPFFGQTTEGMIQSVCLLSLAEVSSWLKTAYWVVVISLAIWGVLTVALQNCHQTFWEQNKGKISLILGAVGTLLFIVSLQPYAAVFLFALLIIKAFMLTKKQ